LALAAKVRLELAEHGQHVEECLSRCRSGIDRLFRRLQVSAFGLQRPHDVLKIADASGEPVYARDYECVSLADEVEQGREFRPAFPARALIN
jgi:hypothetical protein